MTLWEKTLRLIGVIVLILVALLYLVQRAVVLRSALALEEHHMRGEVEQVLHALRQEVRYLDLLTQDWAAWDDTYRFVLEHNEEYVQSNLVDETFIDGGLNLILIADASAHIVFARGMDTATGEEIAFPEFAQDKLYPGHPLLTQGDDDIKTGILMLSSGPMIISARPILTSENEGPSRGTFIMGRFLDDALLSRLSEMMGFPIHVQPIEEGAAPGVPSATQTALPSGAPVWVQALSSSTVAGYGVLEDVYGQPALLVRLEHPRDFYRIAQRSFSYLAALLILGGVGIFIAIALMLETTVLLPIQKLSEQVIHIRESGDLSARVPVVGEDEIGGLAQRINAMLSALEAAATALRQREQYLNELAKAAQILLQPAPEVPSEAFLESLGKAANASRAYLFLMHRGAHGEILTSQKAEWCAQGVTPQIDNPLLQNFDMIANGFGRWVDVLSHGEAISSLVADLPEQERPVLEMQAIQAILIIPLLQGGKLIGFIGFDRCDEARPWTPAEANLLRIAAADLSALLQSRRAELVQQATYRISEAVHTARDLAELFPQLHAIVAELMPATNFYIALYDAAKGMVSFPYFVDEYDQPPAPKKLGKGLTEYVLRTGEPLLAPPEVFEDLVQRGEVESIGAPSIDWLGVPLKVQDKTIGVLVVQSYTEGIRYGQDEKELLHFVSEQIALAIERKMSQQELQEAARRFHSLLDNVHLAAVGLNREGRVAYVNPYFLQLTGYTLDEILGKDWFETFIPERYRPAVSTIFAELLQEWRHPRYGNPILTKSGAERLIAWNNTLLLDTEGNPVGTMSIGEDITEKRQMEEMLRESEERYRTIFETTSTANAIIEEDATVSLVNKGVEELFGYSREEIEGKKKWMDFIHPDDVPRLWEYHRLRRQEPKAAPGSYECRGIDREGNVKDLYVRVAMIPGTMRSVVSLLDITARKRMEEELRHLKEFNEGIVQGIAEGLLLEDVDGIITFVNPALEELLGYTAAELVGWHWRKIVPPEEQQRVQDQVRQRPAGVSSTYETQLQRKDGSRVPVLISARPLFENSAFVGVLTAVTDLTEYKKGEEEQHRLEEQLRQAQKMEAIGQLAGGVAHEFNNLLTVVLGNTELAMSELPPADPLYKRFSAIHNAAMRGARLTQQLLAYSRRQILQPRLLDVNAVVRDFVEMAGRLIGVDITLQLALAPELKLVQADPGALQHVLMNLVVNARDAMPEGGTLHIRTAQVLLDETHCQSHPEAQPGEYVRLTVADTGVGMDENTKNHLFEPFFTTKGVGKGTGLGLPMTYGIVKEHGGFIEVFSQVGEGTRIEVYLPVAALDGAISQEQG